MRTFCLLIITLGFFYSCTSPQTETQAEPEVESPPVQASLEARIQGAWQSLEDSMYHINFQGESYFSGYGDQLDPASLFAIVDSCEGAQDEGEYLSLTLEDGTPMCYRISKLGEDELELLYVKDGNTLRFFRK